MSNTTLVVPKNHIELLGTILERMGCTDFKQNENKYAPDITFSVEGEMYWGYIKGFTVEINGTNESTLEIVNKQYESVLYTLKEQEKQD